MTNLEIIRAACIAANPQILDLGFGCEIYIEGCESPFIFCCEEKGNFILKTAGNGYTVVPRPGYIKILGRKITLSDVLLAIVKNVEFYGEDFTILADGTMISKKGEQKWNLLDDDLTHQSPETLAFLASLLSA